MKNLHKLTVIAALLVAGMSQAMADGKDAVVSMIGTVTDATCDVNSSIAGGKPIGMGNHLPTEFVAPVAPWAGVTGLASYIPSTETDFTISVSNCSGDAGSATSKLQVVLADAPALAGGYLLKSDGGSSNFGFAVASSTTLAGTYKAMKQDDGVPVYTGASPAAADGGTAYFKTVMASSVAKASPGTNKAVATFTVSYN